MYLGINQYDHTVFEGISITTGRGVWPQPFLSQASIFNRYPSETDVPTEIWSHNFETIFREDFFDPVTRIRRGRLYSKSETHSNPALWLSEPHPAQGSVHVSTGGAKFHPHLATFLAEQFDLTSQTERPRFVTLGDRSAYTIWRFLSAERVHTNEFLVTLKSASIADVLPEINRQKLTAEDSTKLESFLEKAVDAASRSGPESIIDRARDAASAFLSWKLREMGDYKSGEDLAELLRRGQKHLEESSLAVFHNAHVIRILHSRAKPSVQEKLRTPEITESDGGLAIVCLASIVRDLGLAK